MTLLANLNLLRNQEPSPLDLAVKKWIEEQEAALRGGYTLYRNYYRGEHRVALVDRLKKFIPPDIVFRDNYTDVVVDVMAERLNLIGFDAGQDTALADLIWQWWQGNRMDAVQHLVHTEALINGDAYAMVEWDMEAKQPKVTFQDPQMIVARYNGGTRKLDFVSKKWVEQPTIGDPAVTRLNIYYPERVEKYRASGGAWLRHQDEGERDWPVRWVDRRGRPLGITIVHFRNRALSDDYGTSEIADIIPLQDLLNKTLIDLIMVLDTMAFPQRWMLGIETKDSQGSTISLDVTPGAVWSLNAQDPETAKLGQFEAAGIDGPLRALETIVQHISGQSRTPQHLFQLSGNYPSGEALKTAEAGLVKKVKDRQVSFGNAWEDTMAMALRLDSVFGSGREHEGQIISALWEDPETRNEKDHMETLKLKAELGVTRDQLWREMGYSQEQIDQMHEDRQGERVEDSNIGAEILKSFQRGEG